MCVLITLLLTIPSSANSCVEKMVGDYYVHPFFFQSATNVHILDLATWDKPGTLSRIMVYPGSLLYLMFILKKVAIYREEMSIEM